MLVLYFLHSFILAFYFFMTRCLLQGKVSEIRLKTYGGERGKRTQWILLVAQRISHLFTFLALLCSLVFINFYIFHWRYTYSSIESQIRVLGDYAFMFRDYELALSNYRLISTDYKLDKAWKRYAGVQVGPTLCCPCRFKSLFFRWGQTVIFSPTTIERKREFLA